MAATERRRRHPRGHRRPAARVPADPHRAGRARRRQHLVGGARRAGRRQRRQGPQGPVSYLGSYGTRGVGYEVDYLVYQIRRELGLDPRLAGRDRRRRQPRPGARRLRRLRRARLPGRRHRRHRRRQGRHGHRRRARPPPRRAAADRAAPKRVDRRHRHPGRRRPGRRRPAGRGRRHEHPELRPGRARRCRRASPCARSTWPSSCRSSATTSSAGRPQRRTSCTPFPASVARGASA